MTDVANTVEAAVETFDLSDYLTEQSTVPTDTTTVYLDAQAAFTLDKAKTEHDELQRKQAVRKEHGTARSITDDDGTNDRLAELEAKIESLTESIQRSALVVHMRAVGEAEREVVEKAARKAHPINKNMPEEERAEREAAREQAVTVGWLNASVTKIVAPNGAEDTTITPSKINALYTRLYESEWQKLLAKFGELSFASALFDRAVDAGFPGGAPTPA